MFNPSGIGVDQIDWVKTNVETPKPEGMSDREFLTGLPDTAPLPQWDPSNPVTKIHMFSHGVCYSCRRPAVGAERIREWLADAVESVGNWHGSLGARISDRCRNIGDAIRPDLSAPHGFKNTGEAAESS